MEKELLIGEFSKRTGISKRMIRFLDEQKLLEPIHCDEQNGYRYYEENQIQRAMNIRTLQDYGFTLREIQKIYQECPSGEALLDLLKDQEVKLRNESDEKIGQLLRLKSFIDHAVGCTNLITVSNFGEFERSLPMNEVRDLKEEVRKLPAEQYMIEHLEEICKKNANDLIFITFDLDHFLNVNESFGYEAGNRVIERFFGIIEESFQPLMDKKMIARMGGDEFAIAVCETEQEVVRERIEQIIQNTQAWDFAADGCGKKMTCSCGVVHIEKCVHPIELIHQSTKALIEAKRMGRNQYRWYEL